MCPYDYKAVSVRYFNLLYQLAKIRSKYKAYNKLILTRFNGAFEKEGEIIILTIAILAEFVIDHNSNSYLRNKGAASSIRFT